jgi:hypothetical protein
LKKASGIDNDTVWGSALENTNLNVVAGKFNNTTTTPESSTRLNYEGKLHATSFIGELSTDNLVASGTRSSSTFLSGDNTWKIPVGVVGFKETAYASGTGTFTPDPKALYTEVIVTGGGGGGGGVDWSSGFAAAGGGGAGGTTIVWFTPQQMGASATYTIGVGGTAGAGSTGATGGTGGTSTFAPTGTGGTLTATGGVGGSGTGTNTTTTPNIRAGGNGGTSSGGDINRDGGRGDMGIALSATAMSGGTGGASYWGNGGAGAFRTTSGATGGSGATSDGDGGGGAVNSSNTSGVSGGAGLSGKIFIVEYLSA